MNAVDLPILAEVVLLALVGLKTGLLKPISGIGGLVVGVLLAVQYSADLAVSLEQHIEGDTVRRTTAFIAIVIGSAVASRISAFLIKKLLATLVLGWLDHVAGAVAGASLGVVLTGTSVYLLIGANIESTRDALAASKLAPEVSRATLVSSSKPWCWEVEDGAQNGGDCNDIMGLFNQYLGRHISDTVGDFLGDDPTSIVNVVQTTLTGSPQDLVTLATTPGSEEQRLIVTGKTASGLGSELGKTLAETAAGLGSDPDGTPVE